MTRQIFGKDASAGDSDEEIPSLDKLLADLDEADDAEANEAPPSPPPPPPSAKAPEPAQETKPASYVQKLQGDRSLLGHPLRGSPGSLPEEFAVPVSRLSPWAYKEVNRHIQKLVDMNETGLKNECERWGIPYDTKIDRSFYVKELREPCIWRHMDPNELKREVGRLHIPIDVVRGKPVPRHQQELFDLLLQKWGLQVCRRICELNKVQVDRLYAPDVVQDVAHNLCRISMDSEATKEWYAGLGIPKETDLSLESMKTLYRSVIIWFHISWAELRAECESRGVSTDVPEGEEEESDAHRYKLVNDLLFEDRMRYWEQHGLPAKRLGLDGSYSVLQKMEEWEAMSAAQLMNLYEEWSLPVTKAGGDKQALLKDLRGYYIWGCLSTAELQKECRDHGLPAGWAHGTEEDLEERHDENEEDQDQLKERLMHRLVVMRFGKVYEKKGIPVKYLDPSTVVQLYMKFGELSHMSMSELVNECQEKTLPCSPDESESRLRERLRLMCTWWQSPERALCKECHNRGLEAREDEGHQDLLCRLLFFECKSCFDSFGIPTERLGDYLACLNLSAEWGSIEKLSHRDKVRQYLDMGLSSAPPEPELSERLRKVQLWFALPFPELQKDCRRYNVNSIAKEDARQDLVAQLVGKLWGDVEVRDEYARQHYRSPPPPPPPQPQPRVGAQQASYSRSSTAPNWGGFRDCRAGPPRHPPGTFGGKGKGRTGPGWPQGDARRGYPGFAPGPGGMNGNRFAGPGPSAWGRPGPSDPGKGGARQGASGEAAVPANIARHFALLGLPVTATSEEVRKAYRKNALKYHPDKQQPGLNEQPASAEDFHKLSSAHEELIEWLRKKGR